jgi:uncharacterized protein (DUF58 family)
MPSPQPPSSTAGRESADAVRRLSKAGLAFVAVGIAMMASEFFSRLIHHRLGNVGHWIVLVCGGYFLLWGLTDVAANLSPRVGRGAIGRHRFFLPVEGRVFLVILIILFIGSMLGRSNPLLLVFCCLAGPFVVNGVFIMTMLQKLSVSRTLPSRVMAGECFSVDIQLHNAKRIVPLWMMTIRDRITIAGVRLAPSVLFVQVPRRGMQSAAYRASIATRGRLKFGPAVVQSRFPLGIVERGIQFDLPGQLLVYPRLGRLASNWRRLVETTHDASFAAAQVTQSADTFHRLRDYHNGDDRRTIHWRSSARRNELIVREFRDERDSPVVLLLDAWRPTTISEQAADQFELALSFIATVCVQQRRSARDAPVASAASGDRWIEWNGGFQGDPTERLLDEFATLQADQNADWSRLLDFAARTFDRKQTTLLLTPRPETVRTELPLALSELGWDRLGRASLRVMGLDEIETSRAFSWT